jgi:hypothetical protein
VLLASETLISKVSARDENYKLYSIISMPRKGRRKRNIYHQLKKEQPQCVVRQGFCSFSEFEVGVSTFPNCLFAVVVSCLFFCADRSVEVCVT